MKKIVFILTCVLAVPSVFAQEANDAIKEKVCKEKVIIMELDQQSLSDLDVRIQDIVHNALDNVDVQLSDEQMKKLSQELVELNEELETDLNIEFKRIEALQALEGQVLAHKKMLVEINDDGSGDVEVRKWVNGEEVAMNMEEMKALLEKEKIHAERLEDIKLEEAELIRAIEVLDKEKIEEEIEAALELLEEREIEIDALKDNIYIVKLKNNERIDLLSEELEEIIQEENKQKNPQPLMGTTVLHEDASVQIPREDWVDEHGFPLAVQGAEFDNFNTVISPNPSFGEFNYQITSPHSEHLQVNILNQEGTIVDSYAKRYAKGTVKHEFDLSEMPSGVYYIQSILGKEVGVSKVVIK